MFQHLPSSGFNFAQLKISGVDVVWGPDDEISLSVYIYGYPQHQKS
jgi:hypothetical protein